MNVWRLKSLEATNLFRYQDIKVEFQDDLDTYLVLGINEDDAGVDSNGSGKSTFFNIISWILFGRTPTTDSFDKIVRFGQSSGGGELFLVNGESSVSIRRLRNLDGDSTLEFCKNGVKEELRTNTLVQKAILQFFGYSSEMKYAFQDFLSQCYFSTASTKGFLSTKISPKDRQAVLERFLNLEVFDEAQDRVRKDSKGVESEQDVLKGKRQGLLESLEELITVEEYKVDLEVLETSIEDSKKELEVCQKEVSVVQSILNDFVSAEKAVSDVRLSISKLEKKKESSVEIYHNRMETDASMIARRSDWKLKRIDYEEGLAELNGLGKVLSKIDQDIGASELSIQGLKNSIQEVNRHIAGYANQLDKFQVCPSCEKPLMIVDQSIKLFHKQDVEDKIAELAEKLEGLNKPLVDIEETASLLRDRKNQVGEEIRLLRSNLSTLEKLKKQVAVYDFSIIDSIIEEAKKIEIEEKVLAGSFERAKENLERVIKDRILENEDLVVLNISTAEISVHYLEKLLKDVQESLKHCDSDLRDFETQHSTVLLKLEHRKGLDSSLRKVETDLAGTKSQVAVLDYWIRTFPKIKRSILSSFVPLFEVTANRYLSKLDVVERVKFDLITETKSGGTNVGFSISIFDGNGWRDFDTYSQGERSRILVSIGFALHELASHKSGESNFGFLFCDELIDSMDSTGMSLFFSLLLDISGQKFVITHTKPEEIETVCDAKLIAIRRGGVSSICVS